MMLDKPREISGYTPENLEMARRACLSFATILGDLLDEIVIVGGLVPSFLIPQGSGGAGLGNHAGTMDLDVGLSIGLLDQALYREIHRRLKNAGFQPDRSGKGAPVHQRWIAGDLGVTIDFLIPVSSTKDRPGRLRHLEEDFAAILTPGLELAFRKRVSITLGATTHRGEKAERNIWVCDAGPFIVMKALAVQNRDEPKDAYDLYYVIREYPDGVEAIAAQLKELEDNPVVDEAIAALERDCATPDNLGPRRVAEFLGDRDDPEVLEDVVGFVARLVRGFRK